MVLCQMSRSCLKPSECTPAMSNYLVIDRIARSASEDGEDDNGDVTTQMSKSDASSDDERCGICYTASSICSDLRFLTSDASLPAPKDKGKRRYVSPTPAVTFVPHKIKHPGTMKTAQPAEEVSSSERSVTPVQSTRAEPSTPSPKKRCVQR